MYLPVAVKQDYEVIFGRSPLMIFLVFQMERLNAKCYTHRAKEKMFEQETKMFVLHPFKIFKWWYDFSTARLLFCVPPPLGKLSLAFFAFFKKAKSKQPIELFKLLDTLGLRALERVWRIMMSINFYDSSGLFSACVILKLFSKVVFFPKKLNYVFSFLGCFLYCTSPWISAVYITDLFQDL